MLSVGIDVGGSKCLGVVLDSGPVGGDPVVTSRARVPTPPDAPDLLAAVAGLVTGLLDGRRADWVGIGLPGLVDRQGTLQAAPNLPGARGVAFRPELNHRLGVPVMVDNDATCAAWGEHLQGAGRGRPDMVLVTLGTGIGGGVVAAGRLLRGANGFAGEVGHMVVNPSGPQCPCGRRGCWERYASGSGLGRLGRNAVASGRLNRAVLLAGSAAAVRGEHVSALAVEGDAEALEVVAELGHWVALGLANLVSLTDPAALVIGGGLVSLGETLLEPVRRELDRITAEDGRPEPVPVLAAALGEEAGAVGAACLGRGSD